MASLLVLTGLFGLAVINKQYIQDQLKLRNYQPSSTIEQLAADTTMTSSAKRIFYVNHPAVEAKADFAKSCNSVMQEQTIVLGCYHSRQAGIFVLDVTDSRLDGVEPVTAAHEMLHAAYDRLSSTDRTKVDAMLQDYYDNQLTDARIKQTIEDYRKSEPSDLINEMHSIFATEIHDLPQALENYYSQYFTNRQAIANLAIGYQKEFTTRQAKVAEYDKQLSTWSVQIESERTYLNGESEAITKQRNQIEGLKTSGNTKAYNASVPAYNKRVNEYNARVVAQQNLVNQYNDLVVTRNNLQVEVDQLVQSISSSEIPATM